MPSEPRKVLVVEDEPDAAEMFAEMMRVSGFEVSKTESSREAMALVARENPQVVILDVMMPDVSGLEVLKYMRKNPSLAHIPVILVSAKSLPADIQTGLQAGAAAYLTKPVGFHELKQAVERVFTAPSP